MRRSAAGLSWDRLTEQTRMILAEVGAHTGARMYNTMQELAGKKNAIGGTGNHLTDTTLRRLLAKTLEQERPPVQTVHIKLTTAQKQTRREKKGDVYNKNTREHVNWQDCKLDSEETYTGNGLINVQLGISI